MNKEFAIGAVSLDSMINGEVDRLRELLLENYEIYRGNRKPIDISGKK